MLKRLIVFVFIAIFLVYFVSGFNAFEEGSVVESQNGQLKEVTLSTCNGGSVNTVNDNEIFRDELALLIPLFVLLLIFFLPFLWLMWETLMDLSHIPKRLSNLT